MNSIFKYTLQERERKKSIRILHLCETVKVKAVKHFPFSK